jgi:hypothetical protein
MNRLIIAVADIYSEFTARMSAETICYHKPSQKAEISKWINIPYFINKEAME